LAGGPIETCEATIEINALRGGSPSVTVGDPKNITSKARLAKGQNEPDQVVTDTVLTIEAFDDAVLIDTQVSTSPVTLVVGKGGQGDKLTMNIPQCNSGAIDFIATFEGRDSVGGGICTQSSAPLRKTCK
jgi:hypothetical protein